MLLTSAVLAKFNEFDIDHSGSLGLTELGPLLQDLGCAPLESESLHKAMAELDADASGLVDYDEFLPWWRKCGMAQIFNKHDADASGNLDVKELDNVMKDLGIVLTDKETKSALSALDTDGNGVVNLTEYIGWFDLFDMQQEFKIFDSDGSGHVNKREFLQLTTALGLSLTKKERDKVFASLDLDNSGVVTFEEFHPWFKSVRAQTKRFVLGGNKRHWEEDLFLENHNSARLEAAEYIRAEVEQIADEIDAGRMPSRAELLERLCKGSPGLDQVASIADEPADASRSDEAALKPAGQQVIVGNRVTRPPPTVPPRLTQEDVQGAAVEPINGADREGGVETIKLPARTSAPVPLPGRMPATLARAA